MPRLGYAYAVYKFANLSREEVEAMLGITIEEVEQVRLANEQESSTSI